MFVSKVTSSKSFLHNSFKGYQHELNNVGERVLRFNYVYDYENQDAKIEIFKVKQNDKVYSGYEVIKDGPIASFKLEKRGTVVNLNDMPELVKEDAFAYRIVIDNNKYLADSGIKIENNNYTLVSRKGTTPRVQGVGYLVYPDSQRVGVKYRDYNHENTGEIYVDKAEQSEMEKVIRNHSNKTGGNLAGLEYNLDYLAQNGYKIQFSNPIAGADNKTSHRYLNKNNFQIADDMGTMENFSSYARKLFQKGIVYVHDGTFTSEGLEGIHFQYALRWADKNPQFYNWFKMQGLKDQSLGFGVVPKNKENLRHRVINSPVIFNEVKQKIESNPDYNPNSETYFQLYDNSQVTDEQIANLDKPIEVYKKIKSGNFTQINSHDDTVLNYVFEINPKEYKSRLNSLIQYNKKNLNPIKLNTPDGAIFVSQFSNFRIDKKTEGGFLTWDANNDLAKLNFYFSSYDELLSKSNEVDSQIDFENLMRIRASYEVQDMTLQVAKFWTKKVNDIQMSYLAPLLKDVKTENDIKVLIANGFLPKEAFLSDEKINNIRQGFYDLKPKGILNRNQATIKALMDLPLDSLEFAENTVGVLSTSYFSNRATSKETLGLTRFELLQKNNPHLVEPYRKNYNNVNSLFSVQINEFANKIIEELNKKSSEKLLDSNNNYTEYGEYVIEQIGASITKYAFLKSLMGENLKTKILPNGEITYDYEDIKNKTSLKNLGINALNPTDEAKQLENLIRDGLLKLNEKDVDYIVNSILKRFSGADLNSFRLAEAIVNESGLGLAWRLDAMKDVVDQDAIRNREASFDKNWQEVIDFWQKFVQMVKNESPDSYIVAEITDLSLLMQDNYGSIANTYNNIPEIGLKFKNVQDAMIKFLNETGITSEAGYSYFFTDLLKIFSAEFETGSFEEDLNVRSKFIVDKLQELINLRGIDYVRNLYTFVDNHDKPRILHGLALDMNLFHGKLNIFDNNGNLNFSLNRENRIKSMIQLANADDFDSLPLEAKLNIDNPSYFKSASTYAIAMSQLLRNSINNSLTGVATDKEIDYLKQALLDLINGNYKGNGATFKIPSINILELSSLENALRAMLKLANITLTKEEFDLIIKEANNYELIEKYLVQGDFDWSGENANVGRRNLDMLKLIFPEGDYKSNSMKYSPYSVGITCILKEAFNKVKGNDINSKSSFAEASKKFVNKYDRAYIESRKNPFTNMNKYSYEVAKNSFGVRDIKTAINMVVEQAEYKAKQDGVLDQNKSFNNRENIILNIWKSATEPAIQKEMMLYSFLSALVGIPTLYGGDEIGMSGYEEKAKNTYLSNRNPIAWSELENGVYSDYRTRIQKEINSAIGIKNRDGVDALRNGTAYLMSTSNKNVPAMLMQDGYGNMTISVFNATGVNINSMFNYYENLKINNKNKDQFFKHNNIESINLNNPYVPIQSNLDLDFIELGAGLSLPIGLKFFNSDLKDGAIYEVKKIGEKLGIVKQGGGKISLNSKTAKNGIMVLKHVAFRAKNTEGKFVFNNIYENKPIITKGEKLSLLSK